ETAFDDLITEQCEHAAVYEERPSVAVPIDARCFASVSGTGVAAFEFTEFDKGKRIVFQEKHGRRIFDQMTITGASAACYRKPMIAAVAAGRTVEKSAAAEFALCRIFAYERIADPRFAAEFYR